MDIKEQIENRGARQVLAMYPVQCRRWNICIPILGDDPFNGDGSQFLREEIHILYLATAHDDLREPVGLWPGITGFEGWYHHDLVKSLVRSEEAFVSTQGTFGPTKWENQDFHACAGSTTHDRLTLSMGDLTKALTVLINTKKE